MKKTDFNYGWFCAPADEEGRKIPVTLPHDAMITEMRSAESRGRHNIGWFEAHDYIYTKEYDAPKEDSQKTLLLEFEGVYRNAEVLVNGVKAAERPYGYTNFYVDLGKYLKFGAKNEIQVIAHNSDQPNSRWYSGTGIYRPVWLYSAAKQYIPVNGVKIRTISCEEGKKADLSVAIRTALPGKVTFFLYAPDGSEVLRKTLESKKNTPENPHVKSHILLDGTAEAKAVLSVSEAILWNPENPALYTWKAVCEGDETSGTFGIRTLTWTPENGIALNGRHVILKGACIHHDNGLLGACAFPEAEERKIRLLKETGYNAVRSAHNPCSKAMLDACDRLGMLMMDEYVDMWYIHKNRYDYAGRMEKWWPKDLKDMVDKDYNHPCVILYSTGNEVAETGQKKGIELTGKMTEYLHFLDETRPVTCGINIFFNFLYSMGFGVYSDDKAEKEAAKAASGGKQKKKTVGSEFYNTLAGLLGDKAMKIGATLHMCDVKTRGAYANMDVAGYNYGIFRYRHDLKKYPERLILGSETFCKDAYSFYELAKKEPRIVGDFVWAGMDYIGEAGIGAWEYEDHAPAGSDDPGWLTAGSGRLNILGYGGGEACYTKVALEKEKGPYLAVKPVYQKGKHSPSAWKMTDSMESWSWPGCEKDTAIVEVCARAHHVELFLNGKSLGKKTMGRSCVATFQIPYESGLLEAVSYEEGGKEIGRCFLKSASEKTCLQLLPEKKSAKPGELLYIRIRYTDEEGIWKPMEKHRIRIETENAALAGFGNACSYNPDGYQKSEISTYYGEAMAVVRAGQEGEVTVSVTDETGTYTVKVPVSDK